VSVLDVSLYARLAESELEELDHRARRRFDGFRQVWSRRDASLVRRLVRERRDHDAQTIDRARRPTGGPLA
jgi:hypothetical protein